MMMMMTTMIESLPQRSGCAIRLDRLSFILSVYSITARVISRFH